MIAETISKIALPAAIFIMMLGMGLSISKSELRDVSRQLKALLVGIGSLIIISPLIGIAATYAFHLESDLAIGLILLAACPGGLFSNYLTLRGGGSVATSLSLTAIGTLIYLVSGPMWAGAAVYLSTGTRTTAQVDSTEILASLCLFLLLPVIAGVVARLRFPSRLASIASRITDAGAIIAIVAYCAIVYGQRDTFIHDAVDVLPAVLIFDLAVLLAAFLISRIAKLDRKQSVAVLCEHVVRQEGTGVFIAITSLAMPKAAVPLLVNGLTGIFVSLIVIAAHLRNKG